jgi:hypothetical protein
MTYLLDQSRGEHLTVEAFYEDFARHFWNCEKFWKLERAQHFAEPGSKSWQAFNAGDWNEALRLHDAAADDLIEYHHRCDLKGVQTKRIRIVEDPVTPYLQWEMHLLFLRDVTGGPIRVIPDIHHTVASVERGLPTHLPELCALDSTILYEHTYDDHGVINGTIKYTDLDTVVKFRYLTEMLYAQGKPIGPYFLRHIKTLPAPTIAEHLPTDYLQQRNQPKPPHS